MSEENTEIPTEDMGRGPLPNELEGEEAQE